ncbi:MAG: hypothetical protein AAB538_05495 [Patescibacteria group bacterium]
MELTLEATQIPDAIAGQPRSWSLPSGEVVYDQEPSHLHDNVSPELLQEALNQVTLAPGNDVQHFTIDMGRIVGQTRCVETTDADEIVYAQRLGRGGLSRFVKGRKPEDCNTIAIKLRRDPKDDRVYLYTAFVGKPTPSEPYLANGDPTAKQFWDTHALIWGSEPTDEKTIQTQPAW